VGWVLAVQFINGKSWTWALIVVAVVAVVWAWFSARAGREGRAFTGIAAFLLFGASSIFASSFPNVLPSTLDPAFSLTVSNASSGDYTLGVMTIVAAFGLPLVFLYQGWTYWVFRKRVSETHIPDAHVVRAAVLTRES